MKLLAVDASTEQLCLALCLDGEVWAHEEPGGAQTSARLLPAAEGLLRAQGLIWSDLDGFGFGCGPGAFTGLRAACAAVQGLALALNRPAVAIPSLRIVAEAARRRALAMGLLSAQQPCRVRVAVDARMGQVYDGAGHWDGHRWWPLDGPSVRSPDEVAASWTAAPAQSEAGASAGVAVLFSGSGLPLLPAGSCEPLRVRASAWWPETPGRAVALGQCMSQAWPQGPLLDAAQVMPVYVRDQVAQTTREREAARQQVSPP